MILMASPNLSVQWSWSVCSIVVTNVCTHPDVPVRRAVSIVIYIELVTVVYIIGQLSRCVVTVTSSYLLRYKKSWWNGLSVLLANMQMAVGGSQMGKSHHSPCRSPTCRSNGHLHIGTDIVKPKSFYTSIATNLNLSTLLWPAVPMAILIGNTQPGGIWLTSFLPCRMRAVSRWST